MKSGIPRQRKSSAYGGQLSVGVLLCLVAVMVVQTVLAPLHLALADHRHRYNTLSGLFEDVIIEGESPTGDRYVLPSVRYDVSFFGRSRRRIVYTICPASNLLHLRYTASSVHDVVCTHSGRGHSSSFLYLQVVSNDPVFMTAPKQSPPTVQG